MEKLRYIIHETFASADADEREKRLQSLMNTYIRTLEKQIAQNEALGQTFAPGSGMLCVSDCSERNGEG